MVLLTEKNKKRKDKKNRGLFSTVQLVLETRLD